MKKAALIATALLVEFILTNAFILAQAPGTARPAFNYEAAQAQRVATAVRITDESLLMDALRRRRELAVQQPISINGRGPG